MEETQVSIKLDKVIVRHGNYEGHDYYQMVAYTDDGFVLKSKLTPFEYRVIMENLKDE